MPRKCQCHRQAHSLMCIILTTTLIVQAISKAWRQYWRSGVLMLEHSKLNARLLLLIAMTPLPLVNAAVAGFYIMSLILYIKRVLYRN